MKKATALITGAGRGIGLGIARELAIQDYNLVIDDVFEPDAVGDALAGLNELGTETLYVRADISRPEPRRRLVDAALDRFGRIDVLVNNAGMAPRRRVDILEATEESFDEVMSVNLKGPYFLTQLVARHMIEKRAVFPERRCCIINIASLSSYASSPNRGEYCVSKAGISMMTKLYAHRLAEFDIPVYEIRPGIIATRMTEAVKEKYDELIESGLLPIKRWGKPHDIGRAVAALVLDYFPYSTGSVFDVDGGFSLRRL